MNYQEYREKEKELRKKNDLEYLKVQEEMKYALCNIERKVKEHKASKEDKEEER